MQVRVVLPIFAVTVQVPLPTAVTVPSEATVATEVLLEDQLAEASVPLIWMR